MRLKSLCTWLAVNPIVAAPIEFLQHDHHAQCGFLNLTSAFPAATSLYVDSSSMASACTIGSPYASFVIAPTRKVAD